MARLFISYRAADGRDKATALARDLGELFGDAQVFLDKEDLRGGVRWREAISAAIAERPVLLLLLTPQLLAATDENGALRVGDSDDPVRQEVESALAVGAQIVPLLCDDLPVPPDCSHLPPPFDRLGEFSWRQLRAYDWKNDLQRLVADLRALGVTAATTGAPVANTSTPATGGRRRQRGPLAIATLLAACLLLSVAAGWYATRRPAPATAAAGPGAVEPAAPALDGSWLGELVPGERLPLSLRQSGNEVALASAPVDIRRRPDWEDYRKFWREQSPTALDAIAYRGRGSGHRGADGSTMFGIALEVVSSPGETLIDSGNLRCTLAADGAFLDCQLWLNSLQAARPVRLSRSPAGG
ncbi:MAG: toll/interleukin-1 receptor domain-containing protein [Candidatus Accumulibacter similis]|nr:MAG: toll/interleukin-1 receptor domain-containing protein [Candidatus Accumulibacter similis]